MVTGTNKFKSSTLEATDIQVINALQKKVMFFVFDSGDSNDNNLSFFRLRGQESKSIVDFMSSRALPLFVDIGKYIHVTIDAEAFDETENYANLGEHQKECHSPKGSGSESYRCVRKMPATE